MSFDRKTYHAFDKGRWFMQPKGFALAADGNCTIAIAMAYFAEQAAVNSDVDGWFPMSTKRLAKIIGKNEVPQRTILNQMVDLGLIEKRTEGNFPRRRLIKLVDKAFLSFTEKGEKLLDQTDEEDEVEFEEEPLPKGESPIRKKPLDKRILTHKETYGHYTKENRMYNNRKNSCVYYIERNKKKRKRTLPLGAREGARDVSMLDNATPKSFDYQCAKRLFTSLRKNHQIRNGRDLHKWEKEFHLLRVRDEISKQKVKVVLIWFMKHSKEPYVPQVRSAASFRAKFDKIQAAIERCPNNADTSRLWTEAEVADPYTTNNYAQMEQERRAEVKYAGKPW